MKYRVTTDSGSVYLIDTQELTWKKEGAVNGTNRYTSAFPLRSSEGKLLEMPDIEVGRQMRLIGPPLAEGDIRVVRTSPVVSIEEV